MYLSCYAWFCIIYTEEILVQLFYTESFLTLFLLHTVFKVQTQIT